MKTPREILFDHHRAAQSGLDTVRGAALSNVNPPPSEDSPISLRDFLRSLRWHLAGMGAVWLFILVLRMNAQGAQQMMASIPASKIPPSQVIVASLRENRRQLSELIGTQQSEGEQRKLVPQEPRSERANETLTA